MKRKAIFVHDHKFKVSACGDFFSEGKITNFTLRRYFFLADAVTVIARMTRISAAEEKHYALCSGQGISFRPIKGSNWRDIFLSKLISNFLFLSKEINDSYVVVLRLPSIIAIFAAVILWAKGKPYIVEVVGDVEESFVQAMGATFHSKIIGRILFYFTKRVASKATGAIYVTQEVLQKKYPCFGLVDHASNVEIDPVDDTVLQLRLARNFRSDSSIKIGVIGSYYNNYKGIDVAIKAVSRMIPDFPGLRLHILGSGHPDVLKELAASLGVLEYIFFDGIRPKDEVKEWLDDIDVYCQPSRTEGLPRSLIEAMSRGCPAVASDVGGIPELLRSHYLFKSEDSSGLCAVVSRFILDSHFRNEAIKDNFHTASQYSSDVLEGRRKLFLEKISSILDADSA